MSGICGIAHLDGAPADWAVIERMAESMSHRGPDGTSLHCEESFGAGHMALNLTPESEWERQPLVKGDLVLVADARIDNREELIGKLEDLLGPGRLQGTKGSAGPDRPPTDADLILAAYRKWGEGCAAELIGDFAFVVWDRASRRLFMARDPLGLRILYFRIEPERVLFATEVKAILRAPDVPRKIFEPAVAAHLGGVAGKLEWTFYDGIEQVEAGQAVSVGPEATRRWRFWDIDPAHRIRYRRDEDYVEHFREVFTEAVRCRIRSHKPVGIWLSGGIDSGSAAITAGWLAREHPAEAPPEIRAYQFAFDELTECDERHVSRPIVEHFGLASTDVVADHLWPLAEYPEHGPDEDEPFIGMFQALHERSLELARAEGMGVVMSGDAGDVMVGDWVLDYVGLLLRSGPGELRKELAAHQAHVGRSLGSVVKKWVLRPLALTAWPGLEGIRRTRGVGASPWPGWIHPALAERAGLGQLIDTDVSGSPIRWHPRRRRHQIALSPFTEKTTAWVERTRAQAGVGFADPWSDRRIAEFVIAAPQSVLHRVSEPKRIAIRALRGRAPGAITSVLGKSSLLPLQRRGIPGHARKAAEDLLTDPTAAAMGFAEPSQLREQYREYLEGAPPNRASWAVLTLEMWLRKHWRV